MSGCAYLISLIFAPPLPITEPMISFGIVISVVGVGTTPALVAAAVWCPKEAAEFASEAKVAAVSGEFSGEVRVGCAMPKGLRLGLKRGVTRTKGIAK